MMGRPRLTEDQRTAAMVDNHRRRRERTLLALSEWPNGCAPFAGATYANLMALKSRGLVEARYHLTPEGRREVMRLKARK